MSKTKVQILFDAFNLRQQEVSSLIKNSSINLIVETNPDMDKEESLRKLMVNYLPKFRRNNETLSLVLSLLNSLKLEATSDDFRFLDAWNCVYEEIMITKLDIDKPEIQAFLSSYSEILLSHIGILKSN